MKNCLRLQNLSLYSIVLVFFLLLFIPKTTYAKTNLSFATLSPKSTIWGNLIRNIVRQVYKESDKELLIRVYYGGVQGDESEMKDKILLKQIDGGFFTGNGLGALAQEVRILEIPGLIKDYKTANVIYKKMLTNFNTYFNKNGYELLGLSELGFAYFYSQQPINSIDSIKNTRMWLWKGDAFAGRIMKVLEIPAIAVSFTEVLPSLQTGLIDGVYATPTALLSLEWQNQIQYMMDLPITLVSSGIVLSKSTWETLSSKHQKIIKTAIATQLERYRPILYQKEEESLKIIQDLNIKILPSQDTLPALTQTSQSLINNFPPKLRQNISNLITK